MTDDSEPVGPLASLAMAHTMALATLIDILVREKVISSQEITNAYTKIAKDIRRNKKLGVTGATSLERIVSLVRTNRETAGRA